MPNHLHIEDHSGDRKYFTIVPNYIIDTCPARALALYAHIKRVAGELSNGICFLSQATLCKNLDIDRNTLRKYLKYLTKKKLIEFAGSKTIQTPGGPQLIRAYRITNIWKINVLHYEGGLKNHPPTPKGGEKGTSKGGENNAPKKNQEKKREIFLNEDEKKNREKLHRLFKDKMGWA